MTMVRQGEADPIIDLMSDFALSSLLPQGMKTWYGRDYSTTIDLVLATEELREAMLKCMIYGTEHGSDHCAIETAFDISAALLKQQQ